MISPGLGNAAHVHALDVEGHGQQLRAAMSEVPSLEDVLADYDLHDDDELADD